MKYFFLKIGQWNCWYNDTNGYWGAILSRKGKQAIIIDSIETQKELMERIK